MRTGIRAVLSCAVVFASLLSAVGPIGAATTERGIVAQAAQQSSVTGRVLDSRGAPVAGASVEATGGGTRATATSASDGSYTLSLPPGLYTITVSKAGFQQAQNADVTVSGTPLTVDVTMTEATLQTLQYIGRTSSTGGGANRAPFNISEAAVSTLPQQQIQLREHNNLTYLVADLPGVTVSRQFSSTPNTNFAVRGFSLQTRTTIDGHPVSSGIFGTWNTNYAASGIFSNVEVVKGAGLNGAIAGESAIGTVNLRTRDFQPGNHFFANVGSDQYGGQFLNAVASGNFFDNRLSVVAQKVVQGFRGPWDGQFLNRINTGVATAQAIGVGTAQPLTALDQWQGDFSNRYGLQAELAKLRWKFSESTSLTLEYLGLHGNYQPQGGSYGVYYGPTTVGACTTTGAAAGIQTNLANCTASSVFSAPYTFGLAGQTVPGYSWFPNSFIQNNEPQFSAEFKTSLGNDTVFLRPYTHIINRYISGTKENQYPGNGGGWYAVTNVANCQVQFLAPGAAGGPASGAAGPCFQSNLAYNSPSYIGSATQPAVFPTTSVAPNGGTCSPTPPFTCYTTVTGIQNSGQYGYGGPFSQPEVDQLFGYTFTYIHPFGDHSVTFSYDYRQDYTSSASSDQSPAAAGCQFVVGNVSGAGVYQSNGQLFQPGCSTTQIARGSTYAAYNKLPQSSIGTPPTISNYGNFSLNFLFQVTPKLRVAFGNYYELDKLFASVEDPAVLAQYAALGNSAAAPVSLIPHNVTYAHYDPHIGLEYRFDPSLSFRLNGGSSITPPYASVISGFGSVTLPNAANGLLYTVNLPNPDLKPQTTISYDAGFDKRLRDGTVISADYYDINIHNVFLSNTQFIPIPSGVANANGATQSQTINAGQERAYGLEFSAYKNPVQGIGYWLTTSLNRTFFTGLPNSIYAFNTSPTNVNFNVNNVQIFGYPFVKSYGQVFFNDRSGATFSLGAFWEGQDNSTYGPPYVLWDTAARIPVLSRKAFVLLSVENLFNYNTGSALARTLIGQGNVQPAVYLNNGVVTTAPVNNSTRSSLFSLPPQTFRASLQLNL